MFYRLAKESLQSLANTAAATVVLATSIQTVGRNLQWSAHHDSSVDPSPSSSRVDASHVTPNANTFPSKTDLPQGAPHSNSPPQTALLGQAEDGPS